MLAFLFTSCPPQLSDPSVCVCMCVSDVSSTTETTDVVLARHMAVKEDSMLMTDVQIGDQRSGIEAPPLHPGTAHPDVVTTLTQMTDVHVRQQIFRFISLLTHNSL